MLVFIVSEHDVLADFHNDHYQFISQSYNGTEKLKFPKKLPQAQHV